MTEGKEKGKQRIILPETKGNKAKVELNKVVHDVRQITRRLTDD
jgi:hypothetical protein